MSGIKNMSRGGWIVVGIVIALLLVPTGFAAAAALKYTGIEGNNGSTATLNKVGVTSAGQQLTTEASPQNYREYTISNASAGGENGGEDCESAGVVPAGDAFVVQQVEVDIFSADAPDAVASSPPSSFTQSGFDVLADTSTTCFSGDVITAGEAPNGEVGNVAIPLVPGYVVPSGYNLDGYAYGLNSYILITGYIVPSADAPATPQIVTHGKVLRPGPRTS